LTVTGRVHESVTDTLTNTVLVGNLAVERRLENNRAFWSTGVGAPPPFADLVIIKSGPTNVVSGIAFVSSFQSHLLIHMDLCTNISL
jgi:hypothetical protein